ncbi:MAG TPA: 2'-5' RNA ligase family protein [Herpetosiphonaceae bacterium]
MASDLIRRVLVILPAFPNMAEIQAVRRRYDPNLELIGPHITLVFPFESPMGSSELRIHIEGATAGLAPFPVRLGGITAQEGEYLFLNVKRGNDAIVDLHDRLYGGPLAPHLDRAYTFTPHVTIGRLPDRPALDAALADTAQTDLACEVLADTVSVYSFWPHGPRGIEFVVPLGGR